MIFKTLFNYIKKERRNVIVIFLLSIPVVFSLLWLIQYPESLSRAVFFDSDHDYFYSALHILDGGTPHGTQHPGTPLFYILAIVQSIIGGSVLGTIRNAGLIIKIGHVVLTLLASIVTYISIQQVIDRNFSFSIVSILILFSTPSYFLLTTHYGPDLLVASFSLALCLFSYGYFSGEKNTPQINKLAIISGISISIKVSSILIIGPLSIALLPISKGIYDLGDNVKRLIKFWVVSVTVFTILIIPTITNLPSVGLDILAQITSTSDSTSINSGTIYLFSFILFPIILIFVSYFIIDISRLGYKAVPSQLWIFWILTLFIMIVFNPIGSIGDLGTNTNIRNIQVIIIGFIWSTFLILNQIHKSDDIGGKFARVTLLSVIFLSVFSGVSMLYTYDEVNTQYIKGEDLVGSSGDLENIGGKVALAPRTNNINIAPSPEPYFHFKGNHNYGYEEFSDILLTEYSNYTYMRPDGIGDLYSEERKETINPFKGLTSNKYSFVGDEILIERKLADRSGSGVFGGPDANSSIVCIIYPEDKYEGLRENYDISSEELREDLASRAGFETYSVGLFEAPGYPNGDLYKFVVVCRNQSYIEEINSTNKFHRIY